jgi:hypothetical protein
LDGPAIALLLDCCPSFAHAVSIMYVMVSHILGVRVLRDRYTAGSIGNDAYR